MNGLIRELKAAASKVRKGSKAQPEWVESSPLCYSMCGPGPAAWAPASPGNLYKACTGPPGPTEPESEL